MMRKSIKLLLLLVIFIELGNGDRTDVRNNSTTHYRTLFEPNFLLHEGATSQVILYILLGFLIFLLFIALPTVALLLLCIHYLVPRKEKELFGDFCIDFEEFDKTSILTD